MVRVHLPTIPSVPNQFVMHRGPGDAKEADGAVLSVHFLAFVCAIGESILARVGEELPVQRIRVNDRAERVSGFMRSIQVVGFTIPEGNRCWEFPNAKHAYRMNYMYAQKYQLLLCGVRR